MAWRQLGCLGQRLRTRRRHHVVELAAVQPRGAGVHAMCEPHRLDDSCQFTQSFSLNSGRFEFLAQRRGIACSLLDDFVQIASRQENECAIVASVESRDGRRHKAAQARAL